jgi:beta propeller repeat protein
MRAAMLMLLGTAALAFSPGLAAAVTADPDFPICTASGNQRNPDVSGNVVVWDDTYAGYTVYAYDLITQQEFRVGASVTYYGYGMPAVDGNIIVWGDYRAGFGLGPDIYGYYLPASYEFPICTASGWQSSPDISGQTVVWEDWRNKGGVRGYDIYGYDLSTSQEFPIATDYASDYYTPSISCNNVVWHVGRTESGTANIGGYDLATHNQFSVCTASGNQFRPAVSGEIVVWADTRNGATGSDIYGYDLYADQEFAICTDSGDQGDPAISGNIVVWVDSSDSSIQGYDLSASQRFPVCTVAGVKMTPAISGDTVVWSDGRTYASTGYDIYGCKLQGLVQTRFEETDPAITYRGPWTTYTDAGCSGGALAYSSQKWASATFSFSGTGIKWIVAKAPMCGKAGVYLDGVYMGLVDLYSPRPWLQVVLQKTGLTRGSHTISFWVSGQRNPSATNHHISIDALEVIP